MKKKGEERRGEEEKSLRCFCAGAGAEELCACT